MGESVPRRKWLLIVEDDSGIRDLFTEEFLRAGYKTVTCSNTFDAFRILANQHFDCILLDMRLERGGGDQIVATLRGDPTAFNFSTPIVVVSGELNAEVVQKIKSGVSAFFVKPFNLAAVLSKIDTICAT